MARIVPGGYGGGCWAQPPGALHTTLPQTVLLLEGPTALRAHR